MNMKFATLAVLGTLGLMAAAPRAQAADNGFYLGAGITKTEFDPDDIDAVKLDDSSFKVIAGIRPLDWIAFEVNYVDLGSDSAGDTLEAGEVIERPKPSNLFILEIGRAHV